MLRHTPILPILPILCALFLIAMSLQAQDIFNKTFGGELDEHASDIIQTRDGDYLVVGYTYSYGKGKTDVWVMKLDPAGERIWKRYLGGTDFDWPNEVIETSDGNYVIAGYTRDLDTKSNNALIFKLDRNGKGIWSHTYGGDKGDEACSIIETSDGGLAVAGYSFSYSKGGSDIWILRLDAAGKKIWQKNYGGLDSERGHSIVETKDGGFFVGGFTRSYGKGKSDMLVLKLDKEGNGVWKKNFGGEESEVVEAVAQTKDGDLIIAGWTSSEGKGKLDAMEIKMDDEGNRAWTKTFGGAENDVVFDVAVTDDDGLVLTGYSASFGHGNQQVWVLRLDPMGEVEWQKRSNGNKDDYANAIIQAEDGGFAIAGGTQSYAIGGRDMWVMKINAYGNFEQSPTEESEDMEVEISFNDERVETGSKEDLSIANDIPAGDVVESEQAAVYISKDPEPAVVSGDPFKPNLYILSIGISNYNDEKINLTFADIDAKAIADKFATLKGKIFNKVEVEILTNENATLVNIKKGISRLERQATQKDMILMFISSHGALDHKGNLYILPSDFSPYSLFATALNIRDLTEGTNGTPCKKLIMLDACHSGQSGFDLLEFASVKGVNLDNIVQELIEAEPGLTIMTSSSGREYSYENPKWGHGAFTKAILDGLDGLADFNHDEVISLMELNLYVTEAVKDLTNGRQHPYTPINLFGNIPLFIVE